MCDVPWHCFRPSFLQFRLRDKTPKKKCVWICSAIFLPNQCCIFCLMWTCRFVTQYIENSRIYSRHVAYLIDDLYAKFAPVKCWSCRAGWHTRSWSLKKGQFCTLFRFSTVFYLQLSVFFPKIQKKKKCLPVKCLSCRADWHIRSWSPQHSGS